MIFSVAILGASGYVGCELLRLLLAHPKITVTQVTSRSHLGEYVYQVHPKARASQNLKFSDATQLQAVDVLLPPCRMANSKKKIEA
ncbi:MAG: hypothetical protein RMJ60_09215 [Anaerolineales bacterium]|nr:hypothetical protein [Anaerolineales bacterium]